MALFEKRKRNKIRSNLTAEELDFIDLIEMKPRTNMQMIARGFENPKAVYRSVCNKGVDWIGITLEGNNICYKEDEK